MLSAAERQARAWYIPEGELLSRPKETGIAIDPTNPLEIDDAIDVRERSDGTYRVAIHVADAGLLDKDSAIVKEAREKGWSIYGEGKNDTIPMIPLSLSKDKLSLNVNHHGVGAPAVSISFIFNPKGRVISDTSIYKSTLVDCTTLDYAEFSKQYRRKKEYVTRIVALAPILNREFVRGSFDYSNVQEVVGEYMKAANRIVTQEVIMRKIPWLYRHHQGSYFVPLRNIDVASFDHSVTDLLAAIGLAQYSTSPLRHHGLNLTAYTHFTSPLRRFSDLANHLNFDACLRGNEPDYSVGELDQIARELSDKTFSRIGKCALSAAS